MSSIEYFYTVVLTRAISAKHHNKNPQQIFYDGMDMDNRVGCVGFELLDGLWIIQEKLITWIILKLNSIMTISGAKVALSGSKH